MTTFVYGDKITLAFAASPTATFLCYLPQRGDDGRDAVVQFQTGDTGRINSDDWEHAVGTRKLSEIFSRQTNRAILRNNYIDAWARYSAGKGSSDDIHRAATALVKLLGEQDPS